MVNVEYFPCGPFSTNSYLIGCQKTRKGAFIDPAIDSAEKLIYAAKDYEIEAIFLTR